MRRTWIACAVVAAGHLAILYGAGLWLPQAGQGGRQDDRQVLSVHLLAAPGEEATSAAAQGGAAMPSVPVPSRPRSDSYGIGAPAGATRQDAALVNQAQSSADLPRVRFYTTSEVDRPALPASSLELPDIAALVADSSSMMLRIFVDRDGTVLRAEVIRVSEGNHAAAARLALILMETRFVPAKRSGMDVAAVRDLEFKIEPSGDVTRDAWRPDAGPAANPTPG